MKVIVTGASGLLGEDIADVFDEQCDVLALRGRNFLDVSDTHKTVTFIKENSPDLIIHVAGWRDVDACERDKDKALLINTIGTRNMALGARSVGCKFVYISTDSVFDGAGSTPYTEFDRVNPVNVYGYSKLKAEQTVIALSDKYFICRVPILFGSKGKKTENLIYGVRHKLLNGENICAATDQICSPTYTRDIANILCQMVVTEYYGIYHISNEGIGSRFDLFKEMAELQGLGCDGITPCDSSIKFAIRPKYTVFNPLAFRATFGVILRNWKEALHDCIAGI